MTEQETQNLVAEAAAVRARAYVPYSGYPVGAALLADNGQIFTGCNVENASYGLTVCAERSAVVQAVAHGVRAFRAIAVVSENGVTPCGACRQVLAEFSPLMMVIVADANGKRCTYRLSELLPDAFGPEHLRSTDAVSARSTDAVSARSTDAVSARSADAVPAQSTGAGLVQKA
jgi:cytidine deaminase